MKTLFVGGPLDGQRRNLPEECTSLIRRVIKTVSPRFDTPNFEIEEHQYLFHQIGQHKVLFHESIQDPYETMIKGYKKYRRPLTPMERSRQRIARKFRGAPPYTHDQLMNHGRGV